MPKEYIEREAVIEIINSLNIASALYAGRKIINLPPADVAPVRHGRWEERDDGFGGTYYHCSVCGEDWCTIDGTPAENGMRYCPQCGAKMDGDADD